MKNENSRNALTCAHGSVWHPWGCGPKADTPCRKCRADVEQARKDFQRDVFLGIYDARGYTPAERKAAEQKAKGRR